MPTTTKLPCPICATTRIVRYINEFDVEVAARCFYCEEDGYCLLNPMEVDSYQRYLDWMKGREDKQ